MKYFRIPWKVILWEMSWPNLLLLSASIPSFKTKDDEDADDTKPVQQIAPQDLNHFFKF